LDQATLLWELVFGSIGLAMFVYGKKQKNMVALGCGIALILIPYVITDLIPLIVVGLALVIAPFVIKR
jgi:hypothetical protein